MGDMVYLNKILNIIKDEDCSKTVIIRTDTWNDEYYYEYTVTWRVVKK